MTQDQIEQQSPNNERSTQYQHREGFLSRLRAYFLSMPEVRLAYYQPAPDDRQLTLSGPDCSRVVVNFTRSVSSEHAEKRLAKIRKHFTSLVSEGLEFVDIERLEYREACEVAFNAQSIYGGAELVERDRLYRYNVYLEWNAGRRITGVKQEVPPVLHPSLDRPMHLVSIDKFITPIYRHLKLIEGHLRELRRLCGEDLRTFSDDASMKSLAESYMLKAIQSAILITMSVMHRSMRLAARDYRDLFLLMPVFGMASRQRAGKMAHCAEIRDRLMFQYDDVSAVEVYQQAQDVIEALQDFKTFMLEWIFEHYYGASGELVQSE